jgi:histidinol-phosphate/aromatic aminotransferase/cobyric acid decarboxylase-like protein
VIVRRLGSGSTRNSYRVSIGTPENDLLIRALRDTVSAHAKTITP